MCCLCRIYKVWSPKTKRESIQNRRKCKDFFLVSKTFGSCHSRKSVLSIRLIWAEFHFHPWCKGWTNDSRVLVLRRKASACTAFTSLKITPSVPTLPSVHILVAFTHLACPQSFPVTTFAPSHMRTSYRHGVAFIVILYTCSCDFCTFFSPFCQIWPLSI